MITFFAALAILIAGYFTYSKVVERIFGPDDRPTPATTMTDGVDYVPMKQWKIFLIQLLNIAGLGPSLAPSPAHCGDPLFFYGLFSAPFLPAASTISCLG